MSEWLRRQTRNLLGFACAGSNPAVDDFSVNFCPNSSFYLSAKPSFDAFTLLIAYSLDHALLIVDRSSALAPDPKRQRCFQFRQTPAAAAAWRRRPPAAACAHASLPSCIAHAGMPPAGRVARSVKKFYGNKKFGGK
jgi:hypothetical protein